MPIGPVTVWVSGFSEQPGVEPLTFERELSVCQSPEPHFRAMYALTAPLALGAAAAAPAAAGRARAAEPCCSLGRSRTALRGLGAQRRAPASLSRKVGTRASLQLDPIDPAQFEKDWQDADKKAQKASLEFDKICMQANVSRFRARRTLDLEIKCASLPNWILGAPLGLGRPPACDVWLRPPWCTLRSALPNADPDWFRARQGAPRPGQAGQVAD